MSDEMDMSLSAVPLFPLPNVVLLPRAILPLHIFEERYKTMTADALAGDRQIAMALLKPGWERDYYQKPAIEPVVCVGKILTHERLPDGKYNFLLQGHTRARIIREIAPVEGVPYRLAQLEALEESPVLEIDLGEQRDRLTRLMSDDLFGETSLGRQFRQMLTSPMSTADVADLIAFNILEDTSLKQTLLGETDIRRRVDQVIAALKASRVFVEARAHRSSSNNASLN